MRVGVDAQDAVSQLRQAGGGHAAHVPQSGDNHAGGSGEGGSRLRHRKQYDTGWADGLATVCDTGWVEAGLAAVFGDHLNQFPLPCAWNRFNPDKLKTMGRQEVAEDAKQLLLPRFGHARARQAKQDRGVAADDHLELTDLGKPLEQVIPEKVADAAAVGQSDEAGGAAEQFREAADTGFVHQG